MMSYKFVKLNTHHQIGIHQKEPDNSEKEPLSSEVFFTSLFVGLNFTILLIVSFFFISVFNKPSATQDQWLRSVQGKNDDKDWSEEKIPWTPQQKGDALWRPPVATTKGKSPRRHLIGTLANCDKSHVCNRLPRILYNQEQNVGQLLHLWRANNVRFGAAPHDHFWQFGQCVLEVSFANIVSDTLHNDKSSCNAHYCSQQVVIISEYSERFSVRFALVLLGLSVQM